MSSLQVILVDAGTGNLHSVHNALKRLGADVHLTDDPAVVRRGGRIILPGVGAFGHFMSGLQQLGLVEALAEIFQRGDPLLGICVGMQALFQSSAEMGDHAGLGFLPGYVLRFADQPGLKVPHTGWNQLWPQTPSKLINQISAGSYAYFNHAYYCAPAAQGDVLALTDYGPSYASMVQRQNLYGVQFHPEKSQRLGLKILENFIRYC
ncbi:MAG: imidazole glycerol phosphate synthase subunit HisH [Anaerolineaceae bacterium]|nr:imidazole glycerol phosphate synthase subunit HisH [Anaerolineaceae bacterium]